MGSFSEVSLSLGFVPWTPPRVLAAFSGLAVDPLPSGAPVLPEPVVEAWEDFEPDWREAGYEDGEGDPFEDEPWRHDWALWCSTAMGVHTVPRASLTWTQRAGWYLDCRFSWKTGPVTVSRSLEWLGPFVSTGDRDRALVGYALHDSAERPHLFWVEAGEWTVEDLNEPEEWDELMG